VPDAKKAAQPVIHVVHDTTVIHDTTVVHDTIAVHDTTRVTPESPPSPPMTLDGVVALLGLLLAIFALAGATQRRSFFMFMPVRRLMTWLGAAVVLVLVPDLVRLIGIEPHRVVAIGFPIAAFVIAIWATADGLAAWSRGVIPPKEVGTLEELALTALNEANFDEVGRLMRRNVATLRQASEDALVALFDPKLVQAMVTRRNYAHLELLGDENAFGTRQAALTGVDVVSHALLHADPSPVTSIIVKALGGDERHAALTSEKALAERTYGNWRWYTASRSAQIITVVGYEALMSGRYDTAYNVADSNYDTQNGTSGRIKCPAYRAIALHYLALEKAQRYGIIDGADPNDFFSVFKAAFARSRATSAWNDSIKDAPTPFAYLMHETLHFIELLARDCYKHAHGDLRYRDEVGEDILVPVQVQAVFRRTCENWALCIWFMTTEDDHVPDKFVVNAMREWMSEILSFGFEHGTSAARTAYAQIAASEFHTHMHNAKFGRLAKEAYDSLDLGKRYISQGRNWLRQQLGPPL